MSLAATNMSSLAKFADGETLNTVLKASIWPMVQLNVPEKYLKPTEDLKPKSSIMTRLEKLRKVLLPNADRACITREPQNNLTRLLPAAVWLKLSHRYLNEGFTKEACEKSGVRAKQLSKLLSSKTYLSGTETKNRKAATEGPKARLKKQKSRKSATAVKKPEEEQIIIIIISK